MKKSTSFGILLSKKSRVKTVLSRLPLKMLKQDQVTEQAFGGVFIYVGLDPVSDFVQKSCRFARPGRLDCDR